MRGIEIAGDDQDPGAGLADGELGRSIGDSAHAAGWHIQQLQTEEGRLDDVFRAITLPETVKEHQK